MSKARRRLLHYAWFIAKNVIGWALILASPPIGIMLPGPGGLPLFLIGFAMITFPGKRALVGVALLIAMFVGVVALAHLDGVLPAAHETVLSQLAHEHFGGVLYANGIVYVGTTSSALLAYDAMSGKQLWTVNVLEATGSENLFWGEASSPLVVPGRPEEGHGGGGERGQRRADAGPR